MKRYHFINENGLSYSFDNRLIIEKSDIKVLDIKISGILSDKFSLIKRLLRNGIFSSYQYGINKVVIVCNKKLFFYENGCLKAELDIERGTRPLRQGVSIFNNVMYYGDYWANTNRNKVNLYGIDLNDYTKEIILTFNNIRHIHFVQNDSTISNSLLIGSGDSDSESGIYQFNLQTKKLNKIVSGGQCFRAVSIIQVNEFLIWGTDAPHEQNYIFRLNRHTNDLQKIYKIDGPAYYSTITKNGDIYLATTIEDRDKHQACIYKSTDQGFSWEKYKTFRKDIWHCKYFGYGVIEFIEGQHYSKKLFYNLVGLKREINGLL